MLNLYSHDLIDSGIFISAKLNFHIIIKMSSICGCRRVSWSYGGWIYNYLCNQCLSPLKLWARTPFMERCTRYNIMW